MRGSTEFIRITSFLFRINKLLFYSASSIDNEKSESAKSDSSNFSMFLGLIGFLFNGSYLNLLHE